GRLESQRLDRRGGGDDLEGGARRVEVAGDGAVDERVGRVGQQRVVGSLGGGGVVGGELVGVEAGLGDRGEDRAGARVEGDDGAALVPQGVPGGLLGGGVEGELDRTALRLTAGDEGLEALDDEGGGGAGEGGVGGQLEAGAL